MASAPSSRNSKVFRRARRYILHYILLAAFCLAIAFVMCYTVFFKLEKVKIEGCNIYSKEQIVREIGAEKGESLFHINISNAEKKLKGKLPYIRSVKIKRRFPTTLKVEIEEEDLLGAVYTDEGFVLLSTTGKVLETNLMSLPEGTPRVLGITGQLYETGSYLREPAPNNAETLKEIQVLSQVYNELTKNGFTDITYYDVTDVLGIQVFIENRLLLKLGTEMDMDYKISFIKGVLDGKKNNQEEFKNVPEEGVLDFSAPPALHTRSVDIEKVINRDYLLDFGIEAVEKDNVAGGQETKPIVQPEGVGEGDPAQGQTMVNGVPQTPSQTQTPESQPVPPGQEAVQGQTTVPDPSVPQIPSAQSPEINQPTAPVPPAQPPVVDQPTNPVPPVVNQPTNPIAPDVPAPPAPPAAAEPSEPPENQGIFNAPSQAPIVN